MLLNHLSNTSQNDSSTTGYSAHPLGNSDRIRLKFGDYGIEVLESDSRVRVSNLYSIHRGKKTSRTLAVVVFPADIETAYRDEHEAILNGQSIGIVFKKNGWLIKKHHQYFGVIETSPGQPPIHSVFDNDAGIPPVIHIYSLFIKKNQAAFQYASIAEIHHPQYLGMKELEAIYGREINDKRVIDSTVSDFLEIVKSRLQGD